MLHKKRRSVMQIIPEALPLLGAGLLSSEFEKLKVQIIYGVLVGGHPPFGLVQIQPTRGAAWRRWQILFGKKRSFLRT
jgi:hypothetical protein